MNDRLLKTVSGLHGSTVTFPEDEDNGKRYSSTIWTFNGESKDFHRVRDVPHRYPLVAVGFDEVTFQMSCDQNITIRSLKQLMQRLNCRLRDIFPDA